MAIKACGLEKRMMKERLKEPRHSKSKAKPVADTAQRHRALQVKEPSGSAKKGCPEVPRNIKEDGGEAAGTLKILKTRKPVIVWSQPDFDREVNKAQEIGPKEMSDTELLSFCRGAHSYFYAHFWADARPFFVELWKRIEEHKMPEVQNSKTEACKRIGCSIRWAQMIVRGTAKDSNAEKAKKKKIESEVTSPSQELLTDDEYVTQVLRFAFETLEPLLRDNWERYRAICAELSKQFCEASKTPDADNQRLPGVEGKSVRTGQIISGGADVQPETR
jgi:hypothetical protein